MWTLILCCGFVIGGISANLVFYREGGTATLECTGEGDVLFWFLHGKGSAIDDKYVDEGLSLNENGTLFFENVSKAKHEGSHLCITKIEETYKAFSVDMKIRPLYPQNLWKARYRGMFVTRLIAALVCLMLFAGFCLVHRYRYREPLEKDLIMKFASYSKDFLRRGMTVPVIQFHTRYFLLITCILLIITYVRFELKGLCTVKELFKETTGSNGSNGYDKVPSFEDLLKGPYSIAQDDPRLIELLRNKYLRTPSSLPYKLARPNVEDPTQFGQTREIRKLLKDKRNGFFIESGGFTGEDDSNSLYFERFMGWNGVVIEPLPHHYKEILSKNRKCWTAQLCLSPNPYPSEVTFIVDGVGSAISSFGEETNETTMLSNIQCMPLYSILLALGITKVDYLSLDVEAAEFEVLKTIPWDKVNISTLSVEVQFFDDTDVIVKYMESLGYKFLKKLHIDFIFYHPLLI